MLLIATGKEVHTKGAFTKHVTSFRELTNIDLGYKLELLDDEELDLFKIFINRSLRNSIAHLNFRIQENGEIREIKGNNPINVDEEISKFWAGVDTMKLILEDSKFLESLQTLSSNVERERGNNRNNLPPS
jgi:hypothetical protein